MRSWSGSNQAEYVYLKDLCVENWKASEAQFVLLFLARSISKSNELQRSFPDHPLTAWMRTTNHGLLLDIFQAPTITIVDHLDHAKDAFVTTVYPEKVVAALYYAPVIDSC